MWLANAERDSDNMIVILSSAAKPERPQRCGPKGAAPALTVYKIKTFTNFWIKSDDTIRLLYSFTFIPFDRFLHVWLTYCLTFCSLGWLTRICWNQALWLLNLRDGRSGHSKHSKYTTLSLTISAGVHWPKFVMSVPVLYLHLTVSRSLINAIVIQHHLKIWR